MKNILIIGNLEEVRKKLRDCLQEIFQVYMCPLKQEDVKTMIEVIKPQLLLLCELGTGAKELENFSWLCGNVPGCPILGVANEQDWRRCRKYYQGGQFHLLIRPVSKQKLLETCQDLIGRSQRKMPQEIGAAVGNGKKKILLVDDSGVMLRRLKGMLERSYDISMAKSGEQALKMMAKELPDLVLLDYEMEGMNGKETYERMKKDDKMKKIPVIFLTGNGERKAIYSILATRPAGYILKPPEEAKILEKIQEVLLKDKWEIP